MERTGSKIEALLHEKILLYRDLLDVIGEEKQAILCTDLEALWKISDKKQKIASDIESVRGRILDLLNDGSILQEIDDKTLDIFKILPLLPDPLAERLRTSACALASIKENLHARLTENKRYVEEYLDILDDLIRILTHTGQPEPVYVKNRYPNKPAVNLFLHREV